jgi:monovalent cation/hydrogen antiporter
MRGVVTLAAALSIPETVPGRDAVIVCAFATILVTVLVQGTTLGPLIRAVGISGGDEVVRRQETEAHARAHVAKTQLASIVARSRRGDGSERHPRLVEQYRRRAELTAAAAVEDAKEHRRERAEHHSAVLEAIHAARREALRLHHEGEIHDETLRAIEWELDLEQLVSESKI